MAALEDRLLRAGGPGFFELLEILGEAVTIRAPDDSILYANRAAREDMGFESLDELRSQTPRSLLDAYIVTDEHGRTVELEDLPSVRLLRGERADPLLLHVVERATGEVRWRLLKATALRDADGELLAAVTVIENMTAVKVAELRTGVLAESGRLLSSTLDHEQTLRNVAQLAVPALADWCIVDLVDEDLRRENVATAHRDPAKDALAARLRAFDPATFDPGGAFARVLHTGVSELYPDVTEAQIRQAAADQSQFELLRALEMRSVAIVPLRAPRRIVGVMSLVTGESRRALTEDDLALAEQLGRRAALAVENARLHRALADVAATLQRSLLPDELPVLADWDVAALYRPAGSETTVDVGGDFYELFETDAGWCALIGDVTGKGVQAAAMTAVMRHGARFASRLEPQPAAILARLNEFLRQRPGDWLCTALCVQLRGEELVLSSAGHPPALIVSPAGELREAPRSGALLGAFDDSQWPEERFVVGDELLLLYTDGVTETQGERERFGIGRLTAFLHEHARDSPDELLAALDAAIDAFRVGSTRDDIAALALRHRPRGAAS